jgi:large subunit ribosomal protein L18
MFMNKFRNHLERRIKRNRARLAKMSNARLRLSVHRSSKHVYAQIVDDVHGITVAAASSVEEGFAEKGSNISGASEVGKCVAQRAIEKGVKNVIFDRGGYIYHGRVKALAEAARAGGLNF